MALKKISAREREFARLLAEGLRPVEAARKVFKWKAEPNTRENLKAKDLARSRRVKEAIKEHKEKMLDRAAVETLIAKGAPTDWDSLHQYCFDRLKEIRDNPDTPARTRFQAILALEKLSDPASDINLIQKYVNSIWDGFTAHCPCCHSSFPLWKIKNEKLNEYRINYKYPKHGRQESFLERRLHIIGQAERRKQPHKTQLKALASPNRHIVALGSARGGKSFTLAMFGLLFLLIPGVEVWVLARVYDDAESEVEYLDNFLKTMFYPVHSHMYSFTFDKKTGEASINTKWGSVLKVKSSKSKGSITGRELEAILVAEPGWVDSSLFEEVRARMSSRLGRIIAMGTPKGFGQFLGRMMRMTARNMRTGEKLPENARLVEKGAPWGQSIYKLSISPEDNPEYVKSEIEAARMELTNVEFAAEFEGKMVADTNSKFPHITPECLLPIGRDPIMNASFVLGIDQGERNFASCLIAWDGHRIFVVDEYFDNTESTIKANLIKLNKSLYARINMLGGSPDNWNLTIFDADPPIDNILIELEEESRPWKTEYTMRPKNVKQFMNWREETCIWINELAKENRIIFHAENCDLLHEQLMSALIRPSNEGIDTYGGGNKKGWIINDPWRGDHNADAFLMAVWTIYSNTLNLVDSVKPENEDMYEKARMVLERKRIEDEKRELSGFLGGPALSDDPWKRFDESNISFKNIGFRSWYADEG